MNEPPATADPPDTAARALPALMHSRAHAGRGALGLIFRYRLCALRNTARTLRSESLLKIFVVATLGLAFWGGLFLIFLQFFEFLNTHAAFFRPILTRHILGLFFVALLLMLVFSNAIISFHSLFRAPETAFLFSLPVRHDAIFLAKMIESLLFSSWAVFAAGVPLLFAFGIKSGAGWIFYPLSVAFLAPFVVLPAAIGATAALLVTALVPRHGTRVLAFAGALLLIPAGWFAVSLLNLQNSHGALGLEMQANFGSILDGLNFTQHCLLPNYWVSEALIGLAEKRPDMFARAGLLFAAIASSALFALAAGWFIAGFLYEGAFSVASAGASRRRRVRAGPLANLSRRLQARFPEIAILAAKDCKTFLRDPSQWSQVLIFFGILALYIGNLRRFSYPLEEPFYLNLISFLNLGATCMTLATMTSRFVFPLISLEGRRFWILGLAPLKRRSIMLAKFYFSFGGALVLTSALILLSNYILGASIFVMAMQLATGVLISLGLSGLCVGMGALFPSFNERNPSKIVSGFGGTLTLILAIALVILSVMGEGLACHHYLMPLFKNDGSLVEYLLRPAMLAVLSGVVVLNLLAAYLPMKLGIRALERAEF